MFSRAFSSAVPLPLRALRSWASTLRSSSIAAMSSSWYLANCSVFLWNSEMAVRMSGDTSF